MSLVSVIIGVYNGEKYLSHAIESILAQTYCAIEVLVVNDGSDDNTENIAKKYPVRVFSQSNQGQPSALNYGVAMAKGSYVAFLDADDLYLPEKTAVQVEFLEAMPQVDIVFGYVEQFFSPELPLQAQSRWVCPAEITPGYFAAAGLFRKECFARVGPFNVKQRIGAFIEWYMRSTEQGLKHEMLPNQVFRRRIHGNNMGINFRNSRLEYVQIIKAALERRSLVGSIK